jgi:CRP/FNR family transcriptional regulator
MRRLGWNLRLKPGQPLFHQGDPASRVFTVTQGVLKLYKLLPDGRRQVMGFVFPGDFLGISVEDEHGFAAEALGVAELCAFPRSRFEEFLSGHPAMERKLFRLAAHALAAAQAQILLLGRKTAEERVATFFLMLLERAEGTGGTARSIVDLPMRRCDIADYLGLTKETVSRVLALLKRRRLVRLEALQRIEVLGRAGLARIAEGAVA